MARFGRTARFFGNVHEDLVGVPQLLEDAREQRAPRLVGPGSPVRYYAPVAPLAFGATAATLVQSWQSGGDRRLIRTTSVSTALATALSTYLVRSVNLYLPASVEPLSEHDRHRLITTWHRTKAMRLVALAVASASLSRIAPKQSGPPLRSGGGGELLAASS